MKDIFPEYYRPHEAALKAMWEDCLFVLDASVVLALYRLPQEGREDLFKSLEALKERLWMPYHAALEYQRNRLKVIGDQKGLLPDLRKKVSDTLTELRNGFPKHPAIDPDDVLGPVFAALDACERKLTEMEAQRADVHEADIVRDKIDGLLTGRVGSKPAQNDIDAIDKDGERRFADGIPPGFKDTAKTETFIAQDVRYQARFGDLYVWRQTLAHIKEKNISAVVLITNDVKEDWWLRVKGKSLGPLPGLVAECIATGANTFHMYTVAQFLEHAGQYLNDPVRGEAIEQATELEVPLKEAGPLIPVVEVLVDSDAVNTRLMAALKYFSFEHFGSISFLKRSGPRHFTFFSDHRISDDELQALIDSLFKLDGVVSVQPFIALTDSSHSTQPDAFWRCVQIEVADGVQMNEVSNMLRNLVQKFFPYSTRIEFGASSVLVQLPRDATLDAVNAFMAHVSGLPHIKDVGTIAWRN